MRLGTCQAFSDRKQTYQEIRRKSLKDKLNRLVTGPQKACGHSSVVP